MPTPKSTEYPYKKRAEKLLQRLGEYKADYHNILNELEELRVMCLEGITQEKVSVRDGVLTVVERYPAVAQACTMGKLAVVKELSRVAELDTVEPEVNVNINISNAEDEIPGGVVP